MQPEPTTRCSCILQNKKKYTKVTLMTFGNSLACFATETFIPFEALIRILLVSNLVSVSDSQLEMTGNMLLSNGTDIRVFFISRTAMRHVLSEIIRVRPHVLFYIADQESMNSNSLPKEEQQIHRKSRPRPTRPQRPTLRG